MKKKVNQYKGFISENYQHLESFTIFFQAAELEIVDLEAKFASLQDKLKELVESFGEQLVDQDDIICFLGQLWKFCSNWKARCVVFVNLTW